jgi:hypothetical protein
MSDPVNSPAHYTQHPSGVECIEVTEHMNFCRGNAVKYIWRAGEKGREIEDLRKARWYLDREIARLEGASVEAPREGYALREEKCEGCGARHLPLTRTEKSDMLLCPECA